MFIEFPTLLGQSLFNLDVDLTRKKDPFQQCGPMGGPTGP